MARRAVAAYAAMYLGDAWARLICGPPIEPARGPAAHAELVAGAVAQLEADRFASLVEQIAAWPAIAADLRAVADGITTRTPSGRADALWRMHLALRAMP